MLLGYKRVGNTGGRTQPSRLSERSDAGGYNKWAGDGEFHVLGFAQLNRPPCAVERSKTLAGIHPLLDRSMVLFHHIV